MKQENVETIKHVADGVAAVTAVGTMMQLLPAVAALFTIVWTLIRIWETKTVQKLLGRNSAPKDE